MVTGASGGIGRAAAKAFAAQGASWFSSFSTHDAERRHYMLICEQCQLW
ncbi:hypothetical protein ACLQ22_31235 [Micromonospora sp. DT178]